MVPRTESIFPWHNSFLIMLGSCFDMEAAPSAEEPKAEVPAANPETKEASEVKAEVAEEAKEAAEAGNVIYQFVEQDLQRT